MKKTFFLFSDLVFLCNQTIKTNHNANPKYFALELLPYSNSLCGNKFFSVPAVRYIITN
jgi:hypothetical protein